MDDSGVMMIEWKGGVVSVIESGWWIPHMDLPEAATQVYGTKGYGQIFPTELKLSIESAGGRFRPDFPPRLDHCEQGMYDLQMHAFVQSIRKRARPHPDGEHGVRIMKILDACYRSARTGKACRIT